MSLTSALSCVSAWALDLTGRRSIRDLQQTLQDIVKSAVDTVEGVEAGGISITEDGQVSSQNPTSSGVLKLDRLQSELHEGPCITAIDEPPADGIVVAADLDGADAHRWPRFSPHAVEAGFHSMMSAQLTYRPGRMRAALNLYAGAPDVFDADARLTAGLFAVQAAMLLYGSEHATNLQQAVDSRDVIGQAKGILMERFHASDDGAFQMLVRSSQETNMKLVDVASWLREEANQRAQGRS